MADFIQHPVVQALAWALVHFVWQGTAIGLAAFVALRATRRASTRYALGVGALALMLAVPIATFVLLINSSVPASSRQSPVGSPVTPAPAPVQVTSHDSGGDTAAVPAPASLRVSPEMLAIAVISWLGGVAFFSLRLFGGWLVARNVARRTVQPAAHAVQRLAEELAARLEVRRSVRILESAGIAVPVMVGWLKPAIVLPVAALVSLTPSQLEALIAHELAHVRRHDYLINVLQSVAEAVLFYHPAVWWLSRQVRAERELCCDDLAVGVCDRLVYVTALTDLATLATPRIALAATDGHLLNRVRRILGHTEETASVRAGLMPVFALTLAAAVGVPAALASGTEATVELRQPQAVIRPIGEAGAAIDRSGVAIAAERSNADVAVPEPQQSSEQADRQRQVEELRRKIDELMKQLAQLEQRRVGGVGDAQRQQEIQKLAEAQAKAAMAKQQEVQKLMETMAQTAATGPAGEEQRRMLENLKRDVEKMQLETKTRAAQAESARRAYADAQKKYELGQLSESQLKEIESAVKQAQAAYPQGFAAADMAMLRNQLERSKMLYEKGLVSADTLAELQRALDRLSASGDLLAQQKIDMQESLARLARAKSLVDKGVMTQRDLEALQRDIQQRQSRLVDRAIEVAPERLSRSAVRMEPAADQTRAIQRGDMLRITIQGEPDLPTTYEVTAQGTVRVPFLAATKAVGLTAADVRTAIGKLLADRKLGSADRVTVTLMQRR
ncbi:MAG TPA: M56 family metallopeptidase [Vicinamibacterales bacterium]|nr:M56 family metallopeptidase [Vicinamibacterales bacterium]